MPVSWDELDSLEAANTFSVINAPQRVRIMPDPWGDMTPQSLGKKLVARLA
jgi:DNA primase